MLTNTEYRIEPLFKFKHMTSAARPTWSAALASGGGLRDGSSSAPTLQTCSKDQPGHLKLKLRKIGQDAPEEIRLTDFRNEMKTFEAAHHLLTNYISGDSDVEIADSNSEEEQEEKDANDQIASNGINESPSDINESGTENNYSEADDNEEEDEELVRELEKIRKEREAERLAKEKKAADNDPHAALSGNPLLSLSTEVSSFGAKRRWDDDVVFKNQAKGLDEKPEKRFINDTTRSDFHRRFMDKFIK